MKTEGKALESMVSTEGQGITYGEEGEDVGKALLMQGAIGQTLKVMRNKL